jgi:outer membrane immunogenic protein
MALRTVLTGVAALSLISAPAFAADVLPAPPPQVAPEVIVAPDPPVFTWTGGYVGGHAGIGRGHIDNGLECWKSEERGVVPFYFMIEGPGEGLDFDKFDGTDEEPGRCSYNEIWGALGDPEADDAHRHVVGVPSPIEGYLIGTQIGFNRQFGQGRVGFVIGGEVAFSMTSLASQLNGCLGGVGLVEEQLHCYGFEWDSEFRINYLATATLRAGLAFGRFMLYGEGGLALANATWTNTLGFTDTVTDKGYVFGAGLEAMISTNVSLFAEWNRVVIPEHRFIGTTWVIFPTGIDVTSTTDIFKVGFNIRIGRDHPEI